MKAISIISYIMSPICMDFLCHGIRSFQTDRGCLGRMVVGFKSTCAISGYHH